MTKEEIEVMAAEMELTLRDVHRHANEDVNNGSVYHENLRFTHSSRWPGFVLHPGDLVILTRGDRYLDTPAMVTRDGQPFINGAGLEDVMYHIMRTDGSREYDEPFCRTGLRLICRAEQLDEFDETHHCYKMIRTQEESVAFYTAHFEYRRVLVHYCIQLEKLARQEGISLI